jgi:hypothetical protein
MENKDNGLLKIQEKTGLAFVLDTLAVIREQDSFEKACSALCDQFEKHFNCSIAALGWLEKRGIEIRGLSSKRDFDRKTEIMDASRNAMEEAAACEEEIIVLPDSVRVPPNHRLLQGMTSCFYTATLPFGRKNTLLGALLMHKEREPFTDEQLIAARLCLENISPMLEDFYKKKLGLTHVVLQGLKSFLKSIFKIENPGALFAGLVLFVLLGFFLFYRIEYRLSCSFIIKPEKESVITARTSGYIEKVLKKAGDHVEKVEAVLIMDSSEILSRRMELAAEYEKLMDQAGIFRSQEKLGDMMIALASARYTEAGLKSLDHRIGLYQVRSSIKGFITEDRDLFQRLNSPVKEGDELMVVSGLDTLYARIFLPEESYNFYKKEMKGELQFLSRPSERFKVRVMSITPAAETRKGRNVFLLFGALDNPVSWARPGMTGQCYLEAGRRSLAWIVFYRVFDWFEMSFVW